MKSSTTRNFHIPLPARLHDRLRAAAELQHRPATQLAKQAIETWLDEQERLTLHEEIASYAAQAAGSSEDLDEQLEATGLERLNDAESGR